MSTPLCLPLSTSLSPKMKFTLTNLPEMCYKLYKTSWYNEDFNSFLHFAHRLVWATQEMSRQDQNSHGKFVVAFIRAWMKFAFVGEDVDIADRVCIIDFLLCQFNWNRFTQAENATRNSWVQIVKTEEAMQMWATVINSEEVA